MTLTVLNVLINFEAIDVEKALDFNLFHDEEQRCLRNVQIRMAAMLSLPVAVSCALYGREPRVSGVYRGRMTSTYRLTVHAMFFEVVTPRILAILFVFPREILCTSSPYPNTYK